MNGRRDYSSVRAYGKAMIALEGLARAVTRGTYIVI